MNKIPAVSYHLPCENGHVWKYERDNNLRKCKDCEYTEIRIWNAIPSNQKVFWD